MLRKIIAAFVLLVLVAAGALAWMLGQHPSMAPYADLEWRQPAGNAPVKVTFFGVATLLFDDGETAWMTDGFFSRPSKWQVVAGRVEPDNDAIARALQAAHVDKLAAVLPVHSHYDHAMDSPEVARRTGAVLVGSESTANIGRGAKLPQGQIRVARLREPMKFGRFTITLFPGRHAPTGFTGGVIDEPFTPPARASAYKEGQTYAVLVEHEGRSVLVNGSAGFEPGALRGVHADVVMLGIGTLGSLDEDYREAYWREVVRAVGARRVIPIHWDDFTIPSGGPFVPLPRPLDKFDESIAFLRSRSGRDGVELMLPAQRTPMDPWAGLK
jgi:L-ascorbate metabolism protein UlaG (beta-lactamase superfamily)